uniref:(northern house mosquito) hypothetical protein n=1 Tax=Culex pipiens TaxID=7175 RepID=A0A8D8G971_CULPI
MQTFKLLALEPESFKFPTNTIRTSSTGRVASTWRSMCYQTVPTTVRNSASALASSPGKLTSTQTWHWSKFSSPVVSWRTKAPYGTCQSEETSRRRSFASEEPPSWCTTFA